MTRAPQQRLQQSEEFFQSGISNHDDTTSGAAHARSLAALAGRSEGTLPWRKTRRSDVRLGPQFLRRKPHRPFVKTMAGAPNYRREAVVSANGGSRITVGRARLRSTWTFSLDPRGDEPSAASTASLSRWSSALCIMRLATVCARYSAWCMFEPLTQRNANEHTGPS